MFPPDFFLEVVVRKLSVSYENFLGVYPGNPHVMALKIPQGVGPGIPVGVLLRILREVPLGIPTVFQKYSSRSSTEHCSRSSTEKSSQSSTEDSTTSSTGQWVV